MDFDGIRTIAITALFSDDELFDTIVLKGGNAIRLVHGFGTRASLDLDFSMEGDFADPKLVAARIFRSLRERFFSVGLALFDESFAPRPNTPGGCETTDWGGYRLVFKLIDRQKYASLKGDIEAIRREALEVGPAHLRTFTVDFSKFEYCTGKMEAELDDYAIYVYTTSMIAVEKLRAICQQMPAYTLRRHPQARARDFFDIHQLATKAGVRFADSENIVLLKRIFDAKRVPVELIRRIPYEREFHRHDWPSVEASVSGRLESFDYYFDFVVDQAKELEALGVI